LKELFTNLNTNSTKTGWTSTNDSSCAVATDSQCVDEMTGVLIPNGVYAWKSSTNAICTRVAAANQIWMDNLNCPTWPSTETHIEQCTHNDNPTYQDSTYP